MQFFNTGTQPVPIFSGDDTDWTDEHNLSRPESLKIFSAPQKEGILF